LHTVKWKGRSSDNGSLPPGIYLCRITAGSKAHTLKISLQ
jgi:hypothetical protein